MLLTRENLIFEKLLRTPFHRQRNLTLNILSIDRYQQLLYEEYFSWKSLFVTLHRSLRFIFIYSIAHFILFQETCYQKLLKLLQIHMVCFTRGKKIQTIFLIAEKLLLVSLLRWHFLESVIFLVTSKILSWFFIYVTHLSTKDSRD